MNDSNLSESIPNEIEKQPSKKRHRDQVNFCLTQDEELQQNSNNKRWKHEPDQQA
jgi:hypothetical protein